MGLDYGTAYSPTGTDQTDPNYPGGKGVNASSQTAKDGFPSLANRSNDLLGFLQRLIWRGSRGRITDRTGYINEISGSPDSVAASDYDAGLAAIIDPISPNVSEYSAAVDYVFGNLVQNYGSQYLCLVANGPGTSVQNPVADVNGDYWYELPNEKTLRGLSQVIKPFYLGVKPIFDYNDGSYQMVFPFGEFRKGTQTLKYFAVIHDDSNVISSGNIAYAAMGQGSKGAAIATFAAGDYTMIDGKDCALSAQGPNRPATFGRQLDAMQRITGTADFFSGGSTANINGTSGAFGSNTPINGQVGATLAGVRDRNLTFDNANSTSPNAAKVDDEESRMKNLQGGPLAQIVCEVA